MTESISTEVGHLEIQFPLSYPLSAIKAIFSSEDGWSTERRKQGSVRKVVYRKNYVTISFGNLGYRVEIAHSAFPNFYARMGTDWNEIIELIQSWGATISRVDFTFDLPESIISITYFENLLAKNRKDRKGIIGRNLAIYPSTKGSIFIGGAERKSQLRIYRKEKKGLRGSKVFTRIELIVRGRNAEDLLIAFAGLGFDVIRGFLKDMTSFRIPSSKSVRYWAIEPFWEALINGLIPFERAQTTEPIYKNIMERKEDWILKQVAATLKGFMNHPLYGPEWLKKKILDNPDVIIPVEMEDHAKGAKEYLDSIKESV
ncbi:MAG: replication initiation factor domain-containing protein [Fimbriimonadaceae bacterium]|nr:MAG: replication initiation factor domain-containing protein [Fimbriimonadaceae bacterium]